MRAFYSLRLRPLMLLVVSALGFILATTMLAAHNAQEPVGSYIRGTGTRVLNSLTPIALPARPVYVSGPAAMCRATPELAPALEELDEKWGNTALDMSVVFSGSGIRVRRALRKLLRGEPFVVAVLGGSITYGHGINRKEGGKTYAMLLDDMLKAAFPDSDVKVINGAIPAHGTDYFSACYEHHVPRDADLFILEGAVNDLMVDRAVSRVGGSSDTVANTEHLVRQILSTKPDNAVMMLSTWSLPHDYINGAHKHAIVAEYYDVPRVSSRSFLYPYMIQHQDELEDHYGGHDLGHQNQGGHTYMADVLFRYLVQQACRAGTEREVVPRFSLAADSLAGESEPLQAATEEWTPYPGLSGNALRGALDPFVLPGPRINQRLRDKPRPESFAFCRTVSKHDANGVPNLSPSKNQGFEEIKRSDKYYWKADKPGSQITFSDIDVHGGTLGLYYQRCGENVGKMKCWVDNQTNKAVVLNSIWSYVCVGSVGIVATNLDKGLHSVTCEVLEETDDKNGRHDIQIIAVIAH